MKSTTVIRIGVVASVILFCIGAVGYSLARLDYAKQGANIDLLELVPESSVGLLETDNLDFIMNELPHTAYSARIKDFLDTGLLSTVFKHIGQYTMSVGPHGVSNSMSQMMVSFHEPVSPENVVVYFRTTESSRDMMRKLVDDGGETYPPKSENYRGKTIDVYPCSDGQFVASYSGRGFLAMSHQKRLIEEVIDAHKDDDSFADHKWAGGYVSQSKQANHMMLFGRTSSLPLLATEGRSGWCDYDIHINSEVFYMGGAMHVPDSCMESLGRRLDEIAPVREDSLLILSGQERVDSCIMMTTALPQHTLFDECVANLSCDASFIMVVDMDKVAQDPERFRPYLPQFFIKHIGIFSSFIVSVQISKRNDGLSHIFVFTYKE